MPPAARITDPTTHGAPLAPGPGSADVMIGGMPAWRAVIDQHACPAVSISGADGVGAVVMGSFTVLINNMMACRLGDIVVEKPGLAMGPVNPIIMGEPTVEIGEVGMGSPVVVTPIPPLVLLAQAMAASGSADAESVSNAAQALAQSSQDGAPFVEPCPACEALKNAMGSEA
ncbi:MAG: PAAR domain-containing protein [Terriglobia bacterium]